MNTLSRDVGSIVANATCPSGELSRRIMCLRRHSLCSVELVCGRVATTPRLSAQLRVVSAAIYAIQIKLKRRRGRHRNGGISPITLE